LRRHTPSLLAIVITLIAAVLIPGAAVFARPLPSCAGFLPPLAERITAADVIVLATVSEADAGKATLTPNAYLKGPAQANEISLERPIAPTECELAEFTPGSRVLVFLDSAGATMKWPDISQVYLLNDGDAVNGIAGAETTAESDLLQKIRSATNQYAVPAANQSEGASLDWVRVVLPTTVVVLIVFGIGLVLMRTWHRIDPS
jgi:hypothetical protein